MNKENLVKEAFEGYISLAEDENKIIIDLNSFDFCDECKNEEGEIKLELVAELNNMLFDLFEKNGYNVYKNGDIYAEDGQFKDVNPDTVVAIKK